METATPIISELQKKETWVISKRKFIKTTSLIELQSWELASMWSISAQKL